GNYGSTTPVTVAVTMNGLGNTPVVAVARDYIVGVGGTVHVALYYLVVATGGTLTVTVTPSVTTYSAITIDEYLFTVGPAIATDGVSTQTGSSATPTAGTIVPSGTELVYGVMDINNNVVSAASPGSGFTNRYQSFGPGHERIAAQDNVAQTATPVNVT